MACRVGMSTNPQERIDYWKEAEDCTGGYVLHINLTYDQALAKEKEEADARGCRQSGGGPRKEGRIWSVYYMYGCD